MDIIKDFISQINSATTDPVVKLLVISISVLIVVIILSLVTKMIKGLFAAIAKLFKNKKKKSKKAVETPPVVPITPQPEQVVSIKSSFDEKEDEIQAHIQSAHATIQNLNNKLTKLETENFTLDLPRPISINTDKLSFSEEALLKIKHTEFSDKNIKQINIDVEGKGIAELDAELSLIKAENTSTEVTLKNNEDKYLKLLSKRKDLLDLETEAVKVFNGEIANVEKVISDLKTSKTERIADIEAQKQKLLELIETVNTAQSALENAKNSLAENTATIKSFSESITTFDFKPTEYETLLANKSRAVEKNAADLTVNDAELTSLTTDIAAGYKKLAENRAAVDVMTAAIEHLKEEEKLLAEQKAREEAEARQARILEEARKLEEEHRLEEERRKEKARLEAEQAEKQRQAQESVPTPVEIPYVDHTEPLTEEQEVEKAKAMMEAQRARRRRSAKSAEKPVAQPSETINIKPVVEQPTVSEEQLKEPVVEQEIVKKVTQPKEKIVESQPEQPKTFEDPMAKIKAEWEREHDIQAALEAGDVDAAINIANKMNS